MFACFCFSNVRQQIFRYFFCYKKSFEFTTYWYISKFLLVWLFGIERIFLFLGWFWAEVVTEVCVRAGLAFHVLAIASDVINLSCVTTNILYDKTSDNKFLETYHKHAPHPVQIALRHQLNLAHHLWLASSHQHESQLQIWAPSRILEGQIPRNYICC